jgi:lipoprotein-anchoring transpeptidase ErfK/SrfK
MPLEYTVQEGDTLAAVAEAYNVSVNDLATVNGLTDVDVLYVGQNLAMPDGSAPTAAPSDDAQEPSPTAVPSEPTPIPPPASPAAIDEERWINVDLAEQLLTAYEGHVPVRTTLVSTGLPNTPTPMGQFRIWIKLRTDDMAGTDYYIEDVPYVMYFHEGYGLHGVTWHGNFGRPMSHGCVNLPTEEAEWLFDFADVGTLVNIHS